MNVRRSLVLIPLCSLLAGCALISDCTYETRYVSASGTIIEGGSALASAEVTVGANRGSLEWKEFSRTIDGSSLKSHVLAIRLVRIIQPGISLLDIPVDQAGSPLISSGSMIQRPADQTPDLGGLFELVAAGQTAVELDTDLSANPRLSIPLSVTRKQDWYRPRNCY